MRSALTSKRKGGELLRGDHFSALVLQVFDRKSAVTDRANGLEGRISGVFLGVPIILGDRARKVGPSGPGLKSILPGKSL